MLLLLLYSFSPGWVVWGLSLQELSMKEVPPQAQRDIHKLLDRNPRNMKNKTTQLLHNYTVSQQWDSKIPTWMKHWWKVSKPWKEHTNRLLNPMWILERKVITQDENSWRKLRFGWKKERDIGRDFLKKKARKEAQWTKWKPGIKHFTKTQASSRKKCQGCGKGKMKPCIQTSINVYAHNILRLWGMTRIQNLTWATEGRTEANWRHRYSSWWKL